MYLKNWTHLHFAEVFPGRPLDEQVSLLDDVTDRKRDRGALLEFHGHHITPPFTQVRKTTAVHSSHDQKHHSAVSILKSTFTFVMNSRCCGGLMQTNKVVTPKIRRSLSLSRNLGHCAPLFTRLLSLLLNDSGLLFGSASVPFSGFGVVRSPTAVAPNHDVAKARSLKSVCGNNLLSGGKCAFKRGFRGGIIIGLVTVYAGKKLSHYLSTLELMVTYLVILNHGQVTRITLEMAPRSPNFPSSGRVFEPKQIERTSSPYMAGLQRY
ncbi:hypothetical protein TNCV_234541 [Trichonephila clavipes]|uniref:Uncharacterized protein n=1 Tax=Trichonephila clavipes TaxID=2585209 RepID=A0A8X6VNW4_TRICX|nr:hypothetical protein TNCV_234541 [Trichonephila clavipes]